ncbi:MAG: hypothetical protein JSS49_29940 [Planctomycetes bacterium]|nr:hypothetical protein [Planctomycetota bacterium]
MLNVDCPSSGVQRPQGLRLSGKTTIGWRSLDQYRPHQVCVLLLIALSCLLGCDQLHSRPVRSPDIRANSITGSPPPTINPTHAKSTRVISVHGVDTEYHGSTAILPDNRLDHQKGSHD